MPPTPTSGSFPLGQPVDVAEQRGRGREERLTAEPALLARRRAPETWRAGHGGVGDDDAVDAARAGDGGDVGALLGAEVGRNLDQEWRPRRGLVAGG